MYAQSIFEIQAQLCKTMSNAIRLEIVHILRSEPHRVSEIARLMDCPQGTVSRHLSVLRKGNIVTSQRSGQEIVYQITNPKIINICDLMREVLADEAARQSRLIDEI